MTDTVYKPFAHRYYVTPCNSRIQLTQIDGEEIGMETSEDYLKFKKDLENADILARLKKVE